MNNATVTTTTTEATAMAFANTSAGGATGNDSTTSDVFARYDIHQLMEVFAPTGVYAERFVPPVWYLLGFLGNPVSGIIWFGRRMRRNNSSAVYLGSLAISDTLMLFLHLLHNLQAAYGYDVYNATAGCETFMFFYYVPQYLSVLLVAAFTVERYTAVCHPFLKEKWCTVRRASFVTLFFVVVAGMLASAQTYIWTYYPDHNVCNHRAEAVEGDKLSFSYVWTWVVDMAVFVAVPLVVLLFNVLVLREIIKLSRNGVIARQQSRSGSSTGNNTASTVTLLSVSFFLIVTQLLLTLVNNLQPLFPLGERMMTDEEIRADDTWTRMFDYLDARKIVEVLCLSHHACYFVIYALTGKHFRREVVYLLTCRGQLRCLHCLYAKAQKAERYSMVSSNGHTLQSETCTTAYTTSM